MILRFIALGTALSLGGTTVAPGTARMVCRFTGQTMKPCPCPAGPNRGAKMEREGCCEVRAASKGSAPTVLASLPPHPERLDSFVIAQLIIFAPMFRAVVPPEEIGTDPPPIERKYLALAQLLI